MTDVNLNVPPPNRLADEAAGYLAQEFNSWQTLYLAQPPMVQRFLDAQGRKLADSLIQKQPQIHFTLPDKVLVQANDSSGPQGGPQSVPDNQREQTAGGLLSRFASAGLDDSLRQRLNELETSALPAVAAAAGLMRHATVYHMIHNMLPSGRSVSYLAAKGEEVPSIPAASASQVSSAITVATDAIVEEGDDAGERGELLVPYVEFARRFYLPQWVAFGEGDKLLVGSLPEAEAHVASMQRFIDVLHAAVKLAPYVVADSEYQLKRYGILGQLVNQGRALTRYETREIIQTIERRAAANDLNRGLSVSLPYFDDQSLERCQHNFDIIPAGRVMFVPSFVVLACRREEVKVAQDTRLSPSTRKHLLGELKALESAFAPTEK